MSGSMPSDLTLLLAFLDRETLQALQLPFMVAVFFALMYFFILRPEQRREAERKEKLDKLKKNDKVLTRGGIVGVVSSIKKNAAQPGLSEITIRSGEGRLVVVRDAVERTITPEDGKKKSDGASSSEE